MVINTTPVGMPPYENTELPIKWHELINLQTVINLGYGEVSRVTTIQILLIGTNGMETIGINPQLISPRLLVMFLYYPTTSLEFV